MALRLPVDVVLTFVVERWFARDLLITSVYCSDIRPDWPRPGLVGVAAGRGVALVCPSAPVAKTKAGAMTMNMKNIFLHIGLFLPPNWSTCPEH